jgi:hypothetical protein
MALPSSSESTFAVSEFAAHRDVRCLPPTASQSEAFEAAGLRE